MQDQILESKLPSKPPHRVTLASPATNTQIVYSVILQTSQSIFLILLNTAKWWVHIPPAKGGPWPREASANAPRIPWALRSPSARPIPTYLDNIIKLSDIPQMTSDFVENVPLSDRQGNCIPFAAIRWHDFGNRPGCGRPFGRFSCHPDTPLVSQSPCRRFSRPTPERVFVANHQSGPRFSGTKSSAPPPRPIGT